MHTPPSICTVGLCCLLLGACVDTAGEGPQVYVVRPQDTLYSVAWRYDLDFRDLARWNNIGADFRIAVGQVLVLGPGSGSSREGAPRVVAAPALGPATRVPAAPGGTAVARAQGTSQVGTPRPLSRWVWPTDRVGAPRPVPGGGILLSGRLGQDVRAATTGRVVYTGSGLRGYGNLIIIKHAENLLSAYAHNREMLVHEGQEVATAQVIAHMGEGTHQSPILYFEIRQNGRPVDPLPFLSK